ncbi:hypothetical protein L484_011883 [Morus notabilis]|uniref:Uncharacterized protein n=1 Tax=Morus notabilis TaxID=981085 RepID=W9S2E2_9ROSA|nr:hypothetical protein L484_011883 [Morus notabilis]
MPPPDGFIGIPTLDAGSQSWDAYAVCDGGAQVWLSGAFPPLVVRVIGGLNTIGLLVLIDQNFSQIIMVLLKEPSQS